MFYLDTSAAVKLIFIESGSAALRRWWDSSHSEVVSSDLLRTELTRVVQRVDPNRMVEATVLLDALVLLKLSTTVCRRAGMLRPAVLRSLDALHLAAALELGDEMAGLVSYDRRLNAAARASGTPVISPC